VSARFVTDGWAPVRKNLLESLLSETCTFPAGVMTMRRFLETATKKEVTDGMSGYRHATFNRLEGAEQDAYMARLFAKRLYWVNDAQVPKTVFDALVID
jgi:hypothetical protein